MKKNFVHFIKFSIVGIINTLANYLAYILFLKIFNLQYIIAGIIGFITGAIIGFFLNRSYTFNSKVNKQSGLIKYLIIQIFCLGIHSFIQYSSVNYYGLIEELSQFAGIFVTMFVNFCLIKIFIFNRNI